MIDFVYIAMLVAWLIFFGGFFIKDYWILAFGSLFLMALGAYFIFFGFPGIDNTALPSLAMAFIHFGVGAYAMSRGAIEVTKEAF